MYMYEYTIACLFNVQYEKYTVTCMFLFFFFYIYLQIYVEVPRARLTMELAKMKEAEGLVSEAADILQELQVHVHYTRRYIYM